MKACLIPMCIQPEKRSANLAGALDLMEQVGMLEPAPDLVVFPECLDLGAPAKELDQATVEPRGGPFVESLAERARALGLFVAAGVTELEGESVYSCSVLIDPDGDTLAHHRRIAVGQDGNRAFSAGGTLAVRQTPLGRVGLLTGEDLWHGPLPAGLSLMEADLIIVSAGTGGKNRSAAEMQKALDHTLPSAEGRMPAVISVSPSPQAGSSGKSGVAGGSFYRDTHGKLTVYDKPTGEGIIHLEVKL